MSCIRFTTDAMREQLRVSTSTDEPVAQFLSPVITDSKISRLVRLAQDDNHKIRESVALSRYAPEVVYASLAADKVVSVRECVARNTSTPEWILGSLALDENERVRAFVAANSSTPKNIVDKLYSDPSQLVQIIARIGKPPE